MKKILSFTIITIMLVSLLAVTTSAASWISVYIDGEKFGGYVDVKNNTTFVGIRKFSTSMYSNANVTYNSKTKTLTVKTDKLHLTVKDGDYYVIANGRYLYTGSKIYMKNGIMYAPVLTMAKAFGAAASWRDSNSSFNVRRGTGGIISGDYFYDSDEVYWLAKIISAEAQGEVLYGQIAVGNVVLNRVRSKEFPNTIYGVIFDKKYGVQFTPTANGMIYKDATPLSIIAAKICLEGYTISDKILYFVDPVLAPNSWISKNGILFAKIGSHNFYYI